MRLSLLKFSRKQGCAARKCPASCLFVLFHLTLGQQTTPPSCLNILNKVSMWMAWSCFQKTLCAGGGGVIGYSPSIPTHTQSPHPHPLLLHNGFTRRWPCSNEVWSFCDATGKLPCGTVLSILVYLLQFLSAQIHLLKYLAHFVFPAGNVQTNFCKTALNNYETRLINGCTMLSCSYF